MNRKWLSTDFMDNKENQKKLERENWNNEDCILIPLRREKISQEKGEFFIDFHFIIIPEICYEKKWFQMCVMMTMKKKK